MVHLLPFANLFLKILLPLIATVSSKLPINSPEASYKVEKVAGPHVTGEGPHWDSKRQALYYVDLSKASINKYSPREKRLTTCQVDGNGTVSIIIPVEGEKDKFLVTIQNLLTLVTWDGESPFPQNLKLLQVVDKEVHKADNRFDDGKVDPTGRLWIGTMGGVSKEGVWEKNKGSLYSFSKTDLTPEKRTSDVSISNGLAWTKDLKKMYYVDTITKNVDEFDYDAKTGNIKNRQTIFDFGKLGFPDNTGPDGMTIDVNDNLWVAGNGGAGVYNIDPRKKKLIRKIDIPSYQITSCAFGGPHLDELYVTSSNTSQSAENLRKYPDAGWTFKVTGLGVKGRPMLPIKVPPALLKNT